VRGRQCFRLYKLHARLCRFAFCSCRALLIAASSFAGAGDEFAAAIFAELSLPVPTTKLVVVCHGFGCQGHKYGEMPDVEPLEQWLQEGY